MTTCNRACGLYGIHLLNLFLYCDWEHACCQVYNSSLILESNACGILLTSWFQVIRAHLAYLETVFFVYNWASIYFYFSNWYLSFYLTKLNDVFSKPVIYMNFKIVVLFIRLFLCCFYKNICKFKFVNLKLYS